MREAMFIKKNAEKWKTYQQEQVNDPDEASDRFITLMDDLAYAKTFYPKSKATKWVNGLASSVYQRIYKNKKEKYSRVFTFWKYELPLIIRSHHKVFLFTTIFFCLIVTLGVFSAVHNPQFISGVLGDDYVKMTEDNIANGDPFGVYKEDSKFNMFVTIGLNNIKVAFFTFIGGFTAGVFTLKILWDNGLMLGCFEQMFFAHGLGAKSILVIWIHGTLEIASIIIAGVAGFIIASGILFPKTYSRMESFKRNIKDAAKIMIFLVPLFIIAAFLESYVTQQMSSSYDKDKNGMPVWVSITILTVSLSFLIWYFAIWPILLSRKGFFIKKDGIVSRLQDAHV
jgi:uncharacterized membrane protein SpoIIM required for sporulation